MSIDQLRHLGDRIVEAERIAKHAKGPFSRALAIRQVKSLRRAARQAARAHRRQTWGR